MFSLRWGDVNVRQQQQGEIKGQEEMLAVTWERLVCKECGNVRCKGAGNRKQVKSEWFFDEKPENRPPPRPWTISFPSLTPWHGDALSFYP